MKRSKHPKYIQILNHKSSTPSSVDMFWCHCAPSPSRHPRTAALRCGAQLQCAVTARSKGYLKPEASFGAANPAGSEVATAELSQR